MSALILGGLVQRDGFSNVDDSTSDLGAATASSAWIYNRIGTNLTGMLMVVFALGLWRALSPSRLGRIGAALLLLMGITLFLEGFFYLDCQAIDAACENTSARSEGHRWVSRVTGLCIFAAPLVLAFAFRRIGGWRSAWLPTLAAVPVFLAVSLVFSVLGNGAAARAGAVVWFAWLGYLGLELLRRDGSAPASATGG